MIPALIALITSLLLSKKKRKQNRSKAPSDQMLERLLKMQDRKLKNFEYLETSHGKGKLRMSFNNDLSRKEQSFRRMTFSQALRMIRSMPPLLMGIFRSGRFYNKPVAPQASVASPEFLGKLEQLAHQLGAKDIGYVSNIPDSDIFDGMGIPHRNAIVFTVEMNREEIAKAPHFDTFIEVQKGYTNLGNISDRLTRFIRSRGFAAYPGTSLGGLTDYVALAERAGLGAIGYHGLLISPDMGPRLRINTIYTNIENLPQRESPHGWVRDFCAQCKNCVRNCPPNAIYDEPKPRPTGGMISIKYKACLNYFARDWGCAICIKVCPFSEAGYEKIRREFAHTSEDQVPTLSLPPASDSLRVAVMGGGAAGFYLTEALLAQADAARNTVQVDLFEKMPVPFGLVRYGVAPDHPTIKTKAQLFEQTLKDERVNYYGNVALGQDIDQETLKNYYHAVVYATGASQGRMLNIPGESLRGVISAPDFVYWYNAHPDYIDFEPTLDRPHVAIIGTGNVSLDITRMLVKSPNELAQTDMAPYAVAALRNSQITDIHIIGRSGPAQTTFTPKELVEISKLPNVQLINHHRDFTHEVPDAAEGTLAYARAWRNRELFERFIRPADPRAKYRVHFHFYALPWEIVGDGERVMGLRLERARRCHQDGNTRYEGTGEYQLLKVGAVYKSIGYRSAPLPGVAYDAQRGIIPNRAGRVVNAAGQVIPREYTSGWVRRGAQGIIGTNKADAQQVARHIREDYQADRLGEIADQSIRLYLVEKGAKPVDQAALRRILQLEKQRGSSAFRTALKFDTVADMLTVAHENVNA